MNKLTAYVVWDLDSGTLKHSAFWPTGVFPTRYEAETFLRYTTNEYVARFGHKDDKEYLPYITEETISFTDDTQCGDTIDRTQIYDNAQGTELYNLYKENMWRWGLPKEKGGLPF